MRLPGPVLCWSSQELQVLMVLESVNTSTPLLPVSFGDSCCVLENVASEGLLLYASSVLINPF